MTIKKLLLLLLIIPLLLAIQSCGKGSGGGYSTAPPGQPVYIKLIPSRYAAQTNGCIEFYAEVHDANGKLLANIPVQFTNLSEPFGQILDRCGGTEIAPPVRINTDGNGRARVTLYSTTPGFATVLASTDIGEQPRDRKTVLYQFCSTYECLALVPTLTLDVDSVPGDGIYNEASDFIIFEPPPDPDNTVELLATVRSEYGVLLQDAAITWGSDHAEAVFTRTESYTNVNGQAVGIVEVTPMSLRDTDTHVTVWAAATNVSSYVIPYDVVTLFLRPVFIESIDVTADPSVVEPEGTSDITATMTLNTAPGDPVPDGVTVVFSTCLCEDPPTCTICNAPCGIVDPRFSQTSGGEATTVFTAPPIPTAPNTCAVIARVNNTTGFTDILVTTALAVTPDSLDVNGTIGGTATFTVTGGVAPYTVNADTIDPNLQPQPATLAASGDTFDVVVPAGTEDTTVTYTIRDSVGDEVTSTVVITADALSVFPPDITIDGAVGGVAIYTIYDGIPPYDIFTSDPAYPPVPANVAASGDTFQVTVVGPVPPVTVTYTIRDTAGNTTTATLSITGVTTPLAVNPVDGNFSCTTGGTLTFFPSGGLQPYASASLDPTSTITTDDTLMPTSFDVNMPAASCASFPAASTLVNVIVTDNNTPAGTVTIPITVTNP
jgi:hypothetical protein